jgi:hypothetical protein
MAKKAGEIAPFEILARIHFNLQVAVCPAKIWSVLCTYHKYINPSTNVSRAKQAPLPPPCRRRRRHCRCCRRGPRMRCRQRLDIAINAALLLPPKQLRCFALPFFVWEWGREGRQIIWKSKGCFFSENGTNTTLRT